MSTGEIACTYAALLLHDEGIPITAEKIATVVKAANVPVESFWPGLFAKLCEKRDIDDLIMNVGSGGGASLAAVTAPSGDAPSGAAADTPATTAEAATKDESDDDINILDLFG